MICMTTPNNLFLRLKRRLERVKSDETDNETEKVIRDFDNHIEAGFQLATFQGPLCAEPVEGMAFFLESLDIDRESLGKEIGQSSNPCGLKLTDIPPLTEQNRMAQVTGSVISAVRDACRGGLLDWSPRLMLAMYTCDIQASSGCHLMMMDLSADNCSFQLMFLAKSMQW